MSMEPIDLIHFFVVFGGLLLSQIHPGLDYERFLSQKL